MTDLGPPTGRRRLLTTAAGLALAMPWIARSATSAEMLTVADPGGPYGPAFRKAFYDPFERETGVRITNVAREAEPTSQFKAMVETGSYIWDVCTLTASARDILAAQKLLDPIGVDPADAPSLMTEAMTPFWLGTDVFSTVFAYRTDRFPAGVPNSWADFWDVQRFPGRRSMRKNPIDTLEQALMADGVPPNTLYPLDVPRAFKSLDRIKPNISVWWTGGAQSSQLIQSGEVNLAALWNARAQAAIDGGAPVRIGWNQGLYSIEGWGLPRGGPRAGNACRFVRFCTDATRQAVFTEGLSYGPTNLRAYDSIPPTRAASLPTYPANLKQMTLAREDWWSANRTAASERFNTWLLD